MRILLICKALHFTYKGGIQTHVWELSQSLIDMGLEVDILMGGKPGFRTISKRVGGRRLVQLPTLPGYRLKYFSKTLDDLVFNLQVVRWLVRHKGEYDVVHFHGRSGLAWPTLFPGRISNCLVTLHGLIDPEYQHNRKSPDRWLHTRIFGWLERRAIRRLPFVLVVSEDERNRISNSFKRPKGLTRIVPNGLLVRNEKRVAAQKRWIVFVGRMERVKGVDLLPDILERLPADVGLYMVGAGPETKELECRFEEKKLTERVVWTGAVSPDEVLTYIQQSMALVLPSRYEPQGRVVLEAMSQGRPVVASRVGGIPEMLTDGENGILVDDLVAEAFASAINVLLQDPNCAKQMGQRGLERVRKQYTWKRLGPEIFSIYQQLRQTINPQIA